MSTRLYQLKLNQSIVNCGMSYVFKTENGEFFIIDGGYFTPGEAQRLYSFLLDNATGKPIIRGWLFTHAHQDHIGCFIDFIEQYHDDVIIDTLYYNFQPTRHAFALGSWRKKSNDLATIKHFYKVIKKYRGLYNIHTLKANEQIRINELSLDVLYTADDLYPQKASFNDYSAVVRISVNGKRLLFLGDVQKQGSRILLNSGVDLRADYVQVAHHGFNGATKELYKAISPRYALFSCPQNEFEKNKNSDVNAYILNDLGIEKYFVSGVGDVEFEF